MSFLAFKATISFQFGIQSHHLFSVLAFRATISFQFEIQSYQSIVWHSKLPFLLSLALRATFFSVWHSKPPSIHSLAFKATISLQVDIQSRIYNLVFRAIFLVWRSESLFVFSSIFKAILSFFRLTFRVTSSI